MKNVTMADIQRAVEARRNPVVNPLPGYSSAVNTLIMDQAQLDRAVHSGSERAQSGDLSDAPNDGGPKVHNALTLPVVFRK